MDANISREAAPHLGFRQQDRFVHDRLIVLRFPSSVVCWFALSGLHACSCGGAKRRRPAVAACVLTIVAPTEQIEAAATSGRGQHARRRAILHAHTGGHTAQHAPLLSLVPRSCAVAWCAPLRSYPNAVEGLSGSHSEGKGEGREGGEEESEGTVTARRATDRIAKQLENEQRPTYS